MNSEDKITARDNFYCGSCMWLEERKNVKPRFYCCKKGMPLQSIGEDALRIFSCSLEATYRDRGGYTRMDIVLMVYGFLGTIFLCWIVYNMFL